nr:putative uncharacterized protein YHR217C [Penaeus vannamei]
MEVRPLTVSVERSILVLKLYFHTSEEYEYHIPNLPTSTHTSYKKYTRHPPQTTDKDKTPTPKKPPSNTPQRHTHPHTPTEIPHTPHQDTSHTKKPTPPPHKDPHTHTPLRPTPTKTPTLH